MKSREWKSEQKPIVRVLFTYINGLAPVGRGMYRACVYCVPTRGVLRVCRTIDFNR
jgi:hypothetical protein